MKKAAKERESEGVALYAEQQQLALAQLLLERQHENYLVFQRARTEADAALDKASDIYKTKKSDIAAKTSACLRAFWGLRVVLALFWGFLTELLKVTG